MQQHTINDISTLGTGFMAKIANYVVVRCSSFWSGKRDRRRCYGIIGAMDVLLCSKLSWCQVESHRSSHTRSDAFWIRFDSFGLLKYIVIFNNMVSDTTMTLLAWMLNSTRQMRYLWICYRKSLKRKTELFWSKYHHSHYHNTNIIIWYWAKIG